MIKYLEQRNKQLEDQNTLVELRQIREDRALARKRPGDMTPADRETCLMHVNIHLEKLLVKANRDKDILFHMKNHYWARNHICKAKMKILKARLSKALKRPKRPDPLWILAEASLDEHEALWGIFSPNFSKFGEDFVIFENFGLKTGFSAQHVARHDARL